MSFSPDQFFGENHRPPAPQAPISTAASHDGLRFVEQYFHIDSLPFPVTGSTPLVRWHVLKSVPPKFTALR
jgi:hypothetical protein